MKDKIALGRLNFWVNTRCNLHCKLCGSGIPYFKDSAVKDMGIDEFIKMARVIFGNSIGEGIVDSAKSIEINGGEPLLNRDLPSIVEETLKYADRFEKIRITTNGTIPLSNELLAVLKNSKGKTALYLSDYGSLSKKSTEIKETLASNGIECISTKYYGENMHYGGWVDFGRYEARNRSIEQIGMVYKNCPLGKTGGGCWPLWNGQMHICSRSLCGTQQGTIPSKSGKDYLDIFDTNTDVSEKRGILLKIMNAEFITACDYCSGDFGTTDLGKRRDPAEQL